MNTPGYIQAVPDEHQEPGELGSGSLDGVRKISILLAGASSSVTGVIVLIGWAADKPILKSILPQWVSMKPNTAFCFVLLGLALLLAATSTDRVARHTARFCTLFAGLIGLLTLGEYLSGWDPGFDQWLFPEPSGTVGTSHPGRMAPTTAVCFLLLTVGLELARGNSKKFKRFIPVVLALLVAITALVDLFSHFTRPFDSYELWGLTVMALHTAILFALLGIAITLHVWPRQISLFSLSGKSIASFTLWTLVLAASLVRDLEQHGSNTLNEAMSFARVNIRKDISFRKWATSHGGVYVKPSEHTPPNQYLKHPQRDVVTTGGTILTLMNPAYMLREIQQDFGEDYGVRSHITSLKPINPGNAPDAWQAGALASIEKNGLKEVVELNKIDGKPYLRMLKPFIVKSGCLNCHAEQGYKEGDIHGGIDSSVPMEPLLTKLLATSSNSAKTHGTIWLIGAVGLVLFYRREQQLDITAREETDFSDSVINSLPGVFYAYEDGVRLVRWNRKLETVSGYSAAELFNKNILDWFDEKNRVIAEAAFQRMSDGGETGFDVEVLFNGKTVPFYLTASWLILGNKKFIIGVGNDLSEQKVLESQLRQSLKMESVGRLAGGVAHDFNNMLGVILGHAELGLMRLDPANPVCADLNEIKTAAERSADLTRQLLAFARKQTISPKVIDLNDTVTNMLKMLQRLIGEDIQMVWQPSPEPCQVNMDPSQIDQILANLCVNARDAIKDTGRVSIETGTFTIDADYCASNPGATPGDYVRLVVSDTGKGMDRETQSHIFEPFFTTKEMGKGTGLGLATVYGAVKQNNGFINIYSEPGKGTTFSIYLPRETEKDTARRAPDMDGETAVPRGQETILLVEDEAAILNITAIMLEKQGYTVLKAESPGRAMELAREHIGGIHLLMADVIMPEMNGRDLARSILTLHPGMKRLFMSGYTADVIAHHGVLDEGVHFIQKPFSLPNMAAMVREVLDGNGFAITNN